MLYIWKIEEIIQQTISDHQLDISWAADNQLKAPMSFNVSNNTLTFNYLEVNGFMSKAQLGIAKEEYVQLMVCHELGYYLTFKKHKHDLRTLMYGEDEEIAELKAVIETNAWDYGRTLVSEPLKQAYDQLREQNKQLLRGL